MMRQPSSANIVYGLCAGGLAGVFSWLATYPLDVIKTCIQADDTKHPKYNGYMDCIRKGYHSNGLRFFFRGLPSTMIRTFPMNAACFFVASGIMNWAKQRDVHVVVRTVDTMPLIGLATNTSLCHLPQIDGTEEETRQQRSVMSQSLRSFGAFNEAVCHMEAQELATEFYPDKEKYYIFDLSRFENTIDC